MISVLIYGENFEYNTKIINNISEIQNKKMR